MALIDGMETLTITALALPPNEERGLVKLESLAVKEAEELVGATISAPIEDVSMLRLLDASSLILTRSDSTELFTHTFAESVRYIQTKLDDVSVASSRMMRPLSITYTWN